MRQFLFIGILLCIAGLTFSTPTVAGSQEDWRECPDLSNLDRAIPACTRIIKRRGEGPKNTGTAYNNRCAAYRFQGKYEQAISDCTNAIKFIPNYVLAYQNRCQAYLLNKQYNNALADCTHGIELDPNNSDFYFFRAYSHAELGNRTQAIEDYSSAIRTNPESFASYNNRGNLHLLNRNWSSAIADFDKAIALDPADAVALINMGRALSHKDNTRATFDQAIGYLDQALKLKTDDAYIFWRRGGIIANRYYNLTTGGAGRPDKNDEKEDLFNRAIADFDKAVSLSPRYADAYLGLANLYISKEKHAKAIVNLDMVVRLAPEFISGYTKRADARIASGQHLAAIEDLTKAIELQRETGSERGMIGINISTADKEIIVVDVAAGGPAEKAGLKIGDVIEKADGEPLSGTALARASNFISGAPNTKVTLIVRSENDGTRSIIVERRNSNPDLARLFYRRGITRHTASQYKLAIDDFNDALRLGHPHEEVLTARGRAYGRMGEPSKAVENYYRAVVGSNQWRELVIYDYKNKSLDTEEVRQDIDAALKSDSKNIAAIFIGSIIRDATDIAGKVDDYSQIIAINPSIPDIFYLRGQAYSNDGRCDLALGDFEEAIQRDPNNELIKRGIGVCKAVIGSAGHSPESADNESGTISTGLRLIPGLTFSNLTSEIRTNLGIGNEVQGVLITTVDPDSPAKGKGIIPGDVIVEISQERVFSITDLAFQVAKLNLEGRRSALLLITNSVTNVLSFHGVELE